MRKLNYRQKAVLAEFLGNFALAWVTFGMITPIFSTIVDINHFVFRLIFSIVSAILSLKLALDLVK